MKTKNFKKGSNETKRGSCYSPIKVSDILSGEPTVGIPNEVSMSPLSKLAAATNKNAAPKSLGVFFLEFIFPLFLLIAWIVLYSFYFKFCVIFHGYDDIALFVSLINIPVGLSNLCPWIASINNRFHLPRLYELFEKDQIFIAVNWV